MRKWMAALIIIGAALAAGGAAVPERAALAAPAKWSSRVLTPDGEDLYLNMGAVNPTTLAVAAPGSNGGSNLRQVYWRSTAPVTEGGTVCASWSMFPDTAQPGLAHNITPTSALTITRNVWAGAYWTLNVHTWNGPEFTGVAQMDWSDVVGGTPDHPYEPLPWRVCSQLSGSVLRVKLWFPADGT